MPGRFRGVLALLVLIFASLTVNAAGSRGTVLITGANRGIGLAMAEAFSREGYTVIGSARRPAAASALRQSGVEVLQLDVTDPSSVASLARALAGRPIDILINNAGMVNDEATSFADRNIEQMGVEYQVNALGPLRVTQALMPNMMAGERKIVANISSMMGSMALNNFGTYMGYRASKAALNSFTKTLSVDLAEDNLIFVVLHPGYVKTDMNAGEGDITAAESANALFQLIEGLEGEDNGNFYNYDGKPMPW